MIRKIYKKIAQKIVFSLSFLIFFVNLQIETVRRTNFLVIWQNITLLKKKKKKQLTEPS